jgi:hypothetical protein
MARTRSQGLAYSLDGETIEGRGLTRAEGVLPESVSYTPGTLNTGSEITTRTRTRTVKIEAQDAFDATKSEVETVKTVLKSDIEENDIKDEGRENLVGVRAKTLQEEGEVRSSITKNKIKYGKDSKGGTVGVKIG